MRARIAPLGLALVLAAPRAAESKACLKGGPYPPEADLCSSFDDPDQAVLLVEVADVALTCVEGRNRPGCSECVDERGLEGATLVVREIVRGAPPPGIDAGDELSGSFCPFWGFCEEGSGAPDPERPQTWIGTRWYVDFIDGEHVVWADGPVVCTGLECEGAEGSDAVETYSADDVARAVRAPTAEACIAELEGEGRACGCRLGSRPESGRLSWLLAAGLGLFRRARR